MTTEVKNLRWLREREKARAKAAEQDGVGTIKYMSEMIGVSQSTIENYDAMLSIPSGDIYFFDRVLSAYNCTQAELRHACDLAQASVEAEREKRRAAKIERGDIKGKSKAAIAA